MATVLGFLAILFFSSNIACSRSLSEKMGVISANATALILSGILGYIYESICKRNILYVLNSSLRYFLICGLLFVASQVPFYLAIGLSTTREQTIVVGLINYLWCGLSVVFSVPILAKKARWFLVPGCLLAFLGVFLATVQPDRILIVRNVSMVPYLLAAIGAIAWSVYSNLCRKWSNEIAHSGVVFFLFASGIALASLQPLFKQQPYWSMAILPELGYMVTVPILLAYIFWEEALRKGNHSLILAFSYLIPVLSTVISCIYLHTMPPPLVWLGTVLVVAGALVCKYSIVEAVCRG